MTDAKQWEHFRKMAADVKATVPDEKTREAYEADAQRLAGVFRESSKTPLDAAVTLTSISKLAAYMAITPVQTIGEYLDQCIVTYAMAAGIISEDEEVNSQPADNAEMASTGGAPEFYGPYL